MQFPFKQKNKAAATESLSRRARIWANFKSLASTIVFVWLFTNHVAQATVVPTGSMLPTILVGDHFFLDKVAFPANYPEALREFLPERTIRRGDIVAFTSPENPDMRLVKRVIAKGGDTFEIREGYVYINDRKLAESYAVHRLPAARWRSEDIAPKTIPADTFFMMGDNRDDSRDSRTFGVIRKDALIGKPTFVYWSYESEPHRDNRTIQEWAEYYGSVALHFVTRTRWTRTGTVLP
jgi:signal peptidase I